MKAYIAGILVGAVVGAVFGAANAPPPAPNNLRGILAIVGIFLGWLAAVEARRRLT